MARMRKVKNGRVVEMTEEEEAEFVSSRAIPAPVRRIPKSVITQRVIAAGKINEAFAALQSDPSAFARWFSPDAPDVASDNAEAIAFLQAIGCDPNVILA